MRAASLLLLLASVLSAQPAGTSLRGTVTDPSAGVVPGVTVSVTGGGNFSRTVRTDAKGVYQVDAMPAGTYTVRAIAAGFSDWEKTDMQVRAGQPGVLDISLVLRAQAEKVTVTAEGEAGRLDTDPSRNGGALILGKAELDGLADDPTDLAEDLANLAGPAAGPGGAQIFIDGFTGGRLPPKASIREIRINQNPFAAQFDRPGQGRIEIFTKPGTDDLHGSLLFQFSDASLNSRNPFAAVKPAYQRRQWEGEVTMPLGKKTSLSFDFERRDINENALVNAIVLDSSLNPTPFAQAVVTPLTGIESDTRIDRQLSANHTLTLRYGYARDTNDNGGVGGFSLPERAYQDLSTEQTAQVSETAIINTHMVTETRFRMQKADSDQSGGKAAPTISVNSAFTSGGSPVGSSFSNQTRYELQSLTTYAAGKHAIRWGGLIRGVRLTSQAESNYTGTFTFVSLDSYRLTLLGLKNGLSAAQIRASGGGASQFSLAAGNPLAKLTQFDDGMFVQDDWRVRPNLTLSGGLRYETQTHVSDWTGFAPRLGFAWGIGGKKNALAKNIIRGGAGVFYDRLSESLTLDALRQDGVRQQQFLIPNPDFYPIIPLAATLAAAAQPQTIRKTDAHWQAPMMAQTAVAFERQLPKHVTASVNYIHTIGIHALRSRDINAPLANGLTPYGGTNGIYLYETSGNYRQNQLITSVNAKVNARLTLTGSYTYGSARSNTDGAGSFPSNQYDLSTEYSRAGFDVHHRVQFNGTINTKSGFRFSPFLTIASGRPYNITSGTDLNGDGLYTDRPAFASGSTTGSVRVTPYGTFNLLPGPGAAIIPRNYGNAPGLVSANMRVSKTFLLGEHGGKQGSDPHELVFSLNARNFLNHPNFGAPVGNLSSPLFGESTGLASGGGSSGNRRIDLQLTFNY